MPEILVEMLAELSPAQTQAVLHSAREAVVTGKGLILKTQQTGQYKSDFSQAKLSQAFNYTVNLSKHTHMLRGC